MIFGLQVCWNPLIWAGKDDGEVIQRVITLLPSSVACFSRILWLQFLRAKQWSFLKFMCTFNKWEQALCWVLGGTVVNKAESVSAFLTGPVLNITHANRPFGLWQTLQRLSPQLAELMRRIWGFNQSFIYWLVCLFSGAGQWAVQGTSLKTLDGTRLPGAETGRRKAQ